MLSFLAGSGKVVLVLVYYCKLTFLDRGGSSDDVRLKQLTIYIIYMYVYMFRTLGWYYDEHLGHARARLYPDDGPPLLG